jgi:hypothetical protein
MTNVQLAKLKLLGVNTKSKYCWRQCTFNMHEWNNGKGDHCDAPQKIKDLCGQYGIDYGYPDQ